ncbi:MAG: Uma2 family endonuclease [Cyanobacteria bacterium P01_D01_bin.123]
MLQLDPSTLPDSLELLDSDDTPVDNEDQNFVPNVLLFVLEYLWKHRNDWYFGVDMGIYHATGDNPRTPVVPDGFLSVGVERRKQGRSRRSYVMWEENNIPPTFVLEVVSVTPGNEYDEKFKIYEKLGVQYYAIYNPEFWQRDQHEPLEIYKLEGDRFQLQPGEPYWMSELGLGLGRCTQSSDPYAREVLGLFDEGGDRYLTQDERGEAESRRADAQQKRAEFAEQRAEKLAQILRAQGIDADNLPDL